MQLKLVKSLFENVQRIYSVVYNHLKHSSLNFIDDHFSQASRGKGLFSVFNFSGRAKENLLFQSTDLLFYV